MHGFGNTLIETATFLFFLFLTLVIGSWIEIVRRTAADEEITKKHKVYWLVGQVVFPPAAFVYLVIKEKSRLFKGIGVFLFLVSIPAALSIMGNFKSHIVAEQVRPKGFYMPSAETSIPEGFHLTHHSYAADSYYLNYEARFGKDESTMVISESSYTKYRNPHDGYQVSQPIAFTYNGSEGIVGFVQDQWDPNSVNWQLHWDDNGRDLQIIFGRVPKSMFTLDQVINILKSFKQM